MFSRWHDLSHDNIDAARTCRKENSPNKSIGLIECMLTHLNMPKEEFGEKIKRNDSKKTRNN